MGVDIGAAVARHSREGLRRIVGACWGLIRELTEALFRSEHGAGTQARQRLADVEVHHARAGVLRHAGVRRGVTKQTANGYHEHLWLHRPICTITQQQSTSEVRRRSTN